MDNDAAQGARDIEEIKQLKARYFRLLDAKDWAAWTDVFSEDLDFIYLDPAVQNVPKDAEFLPNGAARVGRAALVASVSEAMRKVTTIHHGHMPEITIVSRDKAVGRWGLTNHCEYWGADGALHWMHGYGHYDDEYVRTAAGWRIRVSNFYRRDMLDPGKPSAASPPRL